MEIKNIFWEKKKVLLTGHTGFKGSWLGLWLNLLGAKVTGLALDPPSKPNLYEILNLSDRINDFRGDISSKEFCQKIMNQTSPEIIIHMAAQPLVRDSYNNPLNTFETNIMGTVNILESAKQSKSVKSIIIVTSDKCYENIEKNYSYKENDKLGGHDPYSASKACAEIITQSYRKSFFQNKGIGIASVRAGNVIGGGDWSNDRLIPDIINSFRIGKTLKIRNQEAIRPWQHVLEPLSGYLQLCENLWNDSKSFSGSWNFGPYDNNIQKVKDIANYSAHLWGGKANWELEKNKGPHEATLLQLNSEKAIKKLGWVPRLNWEQALKDTVDWYKTYFKNDINMLTYTINQINTYNENKK